MNDLSALFPPVEAESTSFPKLPTFRQWLKAQGKKKIPQAVLCNLIWTPGKWQNFTLETERFRLRIAEDNPYFAYLKTGIATLSDNDYALFVHPVDRDKGTFTLSAKADEPGVWQPVGENGWKWEQR